MKKKKLCGRYDHEWYEIDKCKDVIVGHPCDYYPEGCDNCLTRFECYTKDNDTYATRISAIFYACKNCPAVLEEGTISEWVTRPLKQDIYEGRIIDIREKTYKGLDDNISNQLNQKWLKEDGV